MGICPGVRLNAMNTRATLLIGALLVSPAWSQESAAPAVTLSAQSFDRSSEAIKKILRDTAATQSARIQISEVKPAKSAPAEFKYVPPEPAPRVKVEEPRLPEAAPPSNGFVSALVDTLLAVEDDGSWDIPKYTCQESDVSKSNIERFETCPGQLHSAPEQR